MENVVKNEQIPSIIEKLLNNVDINQSTKDGFLNSLLCFYNNRKYLSQNQYNALQKMVETYSVDHSEWRNNFGEDKKNIFKICIDFYSKSQYYSNIVNKVKKDVGYIPTEKEYRAICENKYATVLIREYNTPHKYKLGSLVRIRKQLNHGIGNIIEVIEGIDAAVAGAKRYRIYFSNLDRSIEMRERDIAPVRECDLQKIADNNSLTA